MKNMLSGSSVWTNCVVAIVLNIGMIGSAAGEPSEPVTVCKTTQGQMEAGFAVILVRNEQDEKTPVAKVYGVSFGKAVKLFEETVMRDGREERKNPNTFIFKGEKIQLHIFRKEAVPGKFPAHLIVNYEGQEFSDDLHCSKF